MSPGSKRQEDVGLHISLIFDETSPETEWLEDIAASFDYLFFVEVDTDSRSSSITGDFPKLLSLISEKTVSSITIAGAIPDKESLRTRCLQIWEADPRVRIYITDSCKTDANTRQIDLSELVGSDLPDVDQKMIRNEICGKHILVTGACGSFGQKLMHRLTELGAAHITAVDHDETELYLLEQQLQSGAGNVSFYLADITDKPRMEALFQNQKFDLIIHTAAYKHVPVMERHPLEAVRVNVLGSRNIAELADRFGSNCMITLSTDKAVNPANAMGLTKNLVERLMKAMDSQSPTQYTSVRIGNLLGARGSVLPVFDAQIKDGGPVTVTHPEVERYFIPIPDAVDHTLSVLKYKQGGDTYLIDMGKPVKIDELARLLILMHGNQPEIEVPVVYSGLRNGEKMSEQLISSKEEHYNLPGTPLIRINSGKTSVTEIQSICDQFEVLVARQNHEGLKDLFAELRRDLSGLEKYEKVN